MNQKTLTAVGFAALAAAALVTVVIMLRAATWSVDLGTIVFLAWAVSPYACILAACILIEKITSLRYIPLILCVVSILMLGFTLLAYLGTLEDDSSTYALIFISVPILLYAGSFTLLLLGLVIAWLSGRRRSTNI